MSKSPLHGPREPHPYQALSHHQVTGNRLAVVPLAENSIQTHSFWAAPDCHQPDPNLDQPRCSRVKHHLPEERLPHRMSSLKIESSFNGQVKRKRKMAGGGSIILFVYMLVRPPPPCSQVCAGHLDTKCSASSSFCLHLLKEILRYPQHTHNLDRGRGLLCSCPALQQRAHL